MKLAVIGCPLGHTLSPRIQRAAIAALGLDLTYEALETPPDRLRSFMDDLRRPEWLGCNVTVPHKQAVLPALDELSPEAEAIHAVNTILNAGGRLNGFNTDAPAFLADLEAHFGTVAGKRLALLGAGGAAHAVAYALRDKAARVWVINRTPERAEELVRRFSGALCVGRTEDVREAELVVNCTSAGLRPGDMPIAAEGLPEGAAVYDLIYNPPVTRLMEVARERGGRAVNGLGMLVRQAALAFEIWTGHQAPLQIMFEAAQC